MGRRDGLSFQCGRSHHDTCQEPVSCLCDCHDKPGGRAVPASRFAARATPLPQNRKTAPTSRPKPVVPPPAPPKESTPVANTKPIVALVEEEMPEPDPPRDKSVLGQVRELLENTTLEPGKSYRVVVSPTAQSAAATKTRLVKAFADEPGYRFEQRGHKIFVMLDPKADGKP